MAYKMATGMGARLSNVLPTPDPTNPKNKNNESTVTVSRTSTPGTKDGMKGYWHRTETRTTTPGSGGTGGGKITPRKTYKQFAAEGGDVAAAKAYNAANDRTPNRTSTNVTNEFVGRVNTGLTPQGIVPQKETPAKLMPTPKPTVTVTPPPRPAWETGKPPKKRTRGGRGREFRFRGGGSSKPWNAKGFGETVRRLLGSCKSC